VLSWVLHCTGWQLTVTFIALLPIAVLHLPADTCWCFSVSAGAAAPLAVLNRALHCTGWQRTVTLIALKLTAVLHLLADTCWHFLFLQELQHPWQC
jgi:hypothetical protein